ncbi:MAG: aminoacyl-tRNA hydrolase [Acidobacteria bacterium RIFCSPLOWO2_02_FULL_67_36]|nr:MAG: aminoacyl-tRNA hydrolase [Acidobacteria bacterium RIFCSPLOWO2_02_FULL_67_36]OFW20939.1 MAG: aminoacyl-tRNA hydrolase [Acidobacteria bacterium RIFCSPLOWO2_12_FULL_66_21]
MKLLVGLGNPGRKYEGTRHNAGFAVADLLAGRHHLDWESAPAEAVIAKWRGAGVVLAKPLTFVNLSGQAVGDLLRFYKIAFVDLLVMVDDVNLEIGRLRVRPNGSAGGHNGLKSIVELTGTEEFARLRIGVGRGDARCDLADHVLARFEPEERPIVAEAVGRAADAAELFVTDGIAPVMNRYNRKEDAD